MEWTTTTRSQCAENSPILISIGSKHARHTGKGRDVGDGAYTERVNPLDVAFHLRHPWPPPTAIATVAGPSMFLCFSRPLRTGFGPHSRARVHLALHFLGDIGRGHPDHPLISRGHDLCHFRGLGAAGAHHHLSRTDVRREHRLARR